MAAPTCPACELATRLTDGTEVYPLRPELAHKQIWMCDGCGAYVGCHPGTTAALGTPAGKDLRMARMRLHAQRLDPIWQNAWRHPAYAGGERPTGRDGRRRKMIQKAARVRVYAFLADRLGISSQDCHTGMFDLERCRQAWRVLTAVTYTDVRDWAKAQESIGRAA